MYYRRYGLLNRDPLWLIIGANLFIFVIVNVVIRFINYYAYVQAIYLLGLSPATFLHQPWTIITNLFVHGSFWHLFANMLTLYFFGAYLARLVGNKKFLFVYFAGGLAGNIMLLLLSPVFPFSVAIGASGAVFALTGALAVMVPRMKVFLYFIVPVPLWMAVLGGFLILSLTPGIAWQGHLGGLLVGLAAGYIFRGRGRIFIP